MVDTNSNSADEVHLSAEVDDRAQAVASLPASRREIITQITRQIRALRKSLENNNAQDCFTLGCYTSGLNFEESEHTTCVSFLLNVLRSNQFLNTFLLENLITIAV
ncbi:hypothetical protein NPIL_252911 [Nephila pilipes]|uniref:Uncharacterized protein n=1 Tax=Nephila pilipes TaxID=299642 RepID=A0A8X6QQE0_NEPPI|nr:hypothetical protein NPIL_252911 [Nephila pilipes]